MSDIELLRIEAQAKRRPRIAWLIALGLLGELAWQTKDLSWFKEWKTAAVICALTALTCFAASIFVAMTPTLRWAAAHAFVWTASNAKWMTQDWGLLTLASWLPIALFASCYVCLFMAVIKCPEDIEALLGFFGRVKRPRTVNPTIP